jgi:hypothetical protein
LRRVEPEAEHSREDDQPGGYGEQRVAEDDPQGGTGQAIAGRQVAAEGHHHAHRQPRDNPSHG